MGSLQQSTHHRFRTFNNQSNSPGGNPPSPFQLSGSETDVSTSNENLSNEEKYVIRHTARQEPQGQENYQLHQAQKSNRSSLRDSLPSNRSSLDVSSSSYNTLIIHSAGDEPWTGRNSGTPSDILLPFYSTDSSKHSYDGVQEITEIPDDYLNQSSVLKHLAKEVKSPSHQDVSRFSPLPTNNWAEKSPLHGNINNENIIASTAPLSKSQPDLSKVGMNENNAGFRRGVSAPRPPTKGRAEGGEIWPTAEMVDILIKENSALKIELDNCYKRVAKTQKLEQEIFKVHKAQEELVQSCDRKERLERAARGRLQNDNRRLQELNRALREQVDLLSTQMLSRSPSGNSESGSTENLRRELSKREILISQLIQQNKEHVAAKERQEIELAAQRVTLQEQRTHIDILDTALTNAQSNVVRLEEECRKKQVYVERVAQLQRALSSLQLASDRREQTERKLRLQLERELQRTKTHGEMEGLGGAGGVLHSENGGDASETPSELKRRLREKEEKIMRLEGECTKWEQRYLEESALRQAAIDAASIPKDAKIAALEKTSQETEKIIAEARSEKIRHMDEVHAAQKKVADLESRLKDMESKLAERDAMIKVLQKHTYDKDVGSMMLRSPHHTPHPSLAGTDIEHVLGSTREELVSSVLTGSTGFGSGNSYAGSDSSYHHVHHHYNYDSNKSFDSTKQTLDNQLKEIDSQLLSKRALCCFPGFTNPVAASRKGKISKPLLASVVTGSSNSNTGGANSGGELNARSPSPSAPPLERSAILLLEKQGRASQQQRVLGAPSSLPRPPRPSSRLPRYNRLDTPPPRKKSDGGESLSSCSSGGRGSLIPTPPPKKMVGEYGRLSESGASSTTSLRKMGGRRDSGSSEFGKRGGSLGRESKSSTDSTGSNKYRIQF